MHHFLYNLHTPPTPSNNLREPFQPIFLSFFKTLPAHKKMLLRFQPNLPRFCMNSSKDISKLSRSSINVFPRFNQSLPHFNLLSSPTFNFFFPTFSCYLPLLSIFSSPLLTIFFPTLPKKSSPVFTIKPGSR